MTKPRIAIFSGPTATVQNSEPLVTSNKARARHGLPLAAASDGTPLKFDALRPQRLAAPVTVYVEQFSAHPLERDAAELNAPADGYVDASGAFHTERTGPGDTPVYEVTLEPSDGLYWLPYMGRQKDGSAWESECAYPNAPNELCRQTFFPDASRIVEEIDRIGLEQSGQASILLRRRPSTSTAPRPRVVTRRAWQPSGGRMSARATSLPSGATSTSSATDRPTCAASRPWPRWRR